MAGIEDLVIQEIMNDMQQQVAQQPPAQIQPAQPVTNQRGLPPGAVSDPRAPQGFTIADPRLRDQYAETTGRQNAAVATGTAIEAAMRERDKAKFQLIQGLRGLDPQIQSVILQRLGINPGAIKSELQQKMELAKYQQELERPQQEVLNTLKALGLQRQAAQGEQELGLKRQQLEAETAGRADSRQFQLMRTLAALMQSDGTGQLSKALGPILLQMLQGAGIKLNTPSGNRTQNTGRSGVRITRED